MSEHPKPRWGKFFYCPVFFQRITLQICCHRAANAIRGYAVLDGIKHPELAPQCLPCVTCAIRCTGIQGYLKSNNPKRTPNLEEGMEVKLKRMINKRRIRLFGE